MKISYEKALATNLEHYVERGYTLEQALVICLRPEPEVRRVYEIIQEEKKLGCLATHVDLFDIAPEGSDPDESGAKK